MSPHRQQRLRWLLASGGMLLLLGASRCFAPTYADCAFRCGPSEPACPPEYVCGADRFCHLPSSTNVCLFPADLATTDRDAGDLR